MSSDTHAADDTALGGSDVEQASVETLKNKASGENFPVASRILPRELRRDLFALYGFARLVDDAGDETGGLPLDRRLALLDAVERELDTIWTGQPSWPVMRTLATTVRAHDIPSEPFRRLVEANRIDQRVARYETHEQLVEYCEYSANPVGQVVLYIGDAATPERIARSDQVCTALQLLEHSQDVAEDYQRGRVYLPAEDLARAGIDEAGLDAALRADHAGTELRETVSVLVDRSRKLLAGGAPLVGSLHGFIRWAVAGYVAGGVATAHSIERVGYDVLANSPKPSRWRTLMDTFRFATRPASRARSLEAADGEPVRGGTR